MGQAFQLIGNANATTSRTGGVIGGVVAANRAARDQRLSNNQTWDYSQNLQNQATGSLDPYNEAGQQALSPLTGLLTGNQYDPATGDYKAISPEQRDALLYQSPGYRFAVNQTTQQLDRSQAARGLTLSGAGQKELAQYTSGLASQYSNDYINQLANLAGAGQNAAAGQSNIKAGNMSNLAALYQGSLGSTYNAQKWQNYGTGFQQAQELQAQNHEQAGNTLSQMFGGGGAGGGIGGMFGGGGAAA